MLSKNRYVSVQVRDLKLKERNRELSLLLELGDLLGSSMTLEDSFSAVLTKILEYFKMEAGRIYLMDDAGQSLILVAHKGLDPTDFEKIDINDGFSGKSARTGNFIAQYVSMRIFSHCSSTSILAAGDVTNSSFSNLNGRIG